MSLQKLKSNPNVKFDSNHPHQHFQFCSISVHVGDKGIADNHVFLSCPATGMTEDLIRQYLIDTYPMHQPDDESLDCDGLEDGFYWLDDMDGAVRISTADPAGIIAQGDVIFSVQDDALIQLKSLVPALFQYTIDNP